MIPGRENQSFFSTNKSIKNYMSILIILSSNNYKRVGEHLKGPRKEKKFALGASKLNWLRGTKNLIYLLSNMFLVVFVKDDDLNMFKSSL